MGDESVDEWVPEELKPEPPSPADRGGRAHVLIGGRECSCGEWDIAPSLVGAIGPGEVQLMFEEHLREVTDEEAQTAPLFWEPRGGGSAG